MSDPAKKIEDLAAEYFLRDLSDGELERLQEALRRNPSLREEFAESARDEWLLHHVHADMGQVPTAVVPMPKPRTHPAPALAVAALVALFLGLIGVIWINQKPSGEQLSVSPVATLTSMFVLGGDDIKASNNGSVRVLEEGSRLYSGDSVRIPAGGRLSFQYEGEETSLHSTTASRFVLTHADGAKWIDLKYGELQADVEKQKTGAPMRITTKDAEAVVLGTSFELSSSEFTRLAVTSGRVGFQSLSNAEQKVEVSGGFLASSNQPENWKAEPFVVHEWKPVMDHTINGRGKKGYLIIDPKRKLSGFLQFDCGDLNDTVMEAKLQLRVEKYGSESGGDGLVRLYVVSEGESEEGRETYSETSLEEIASYEGKLGAGMDLVFDLPRERVRKGKNTFVLRLEKGGNDFWFSSSEGRQSPLLKVKMAGLEK